MPGKSKFSKPVSLDMALRLNVGSLVPALIAGLAVQIFRMTQHRWLPAVWIEFGVFSIASVVMFLFLRRWLRTRNSVNRTTVIYLAQAGAVVVVSLLIGWQLISRRIGLGDANEVVALLVIQCISWHLAVFSSIKGFEKASFLLCGATVFFVCCMTTQFGILTLGAMFAVTALWWLAGIYWSRLDSSAIDGNAKALQIHGTSTGIGVIVVAIAVGIAALLPITQSQISIAGFMPFSGGENGYQDEFAMGGVGDGNIVTAGENAKSVGAVNSDTFIEDNKPSMYDVMTEKYEGPVFKKRRNRAVALKEIAKCMKEVKQSEQAGKTFRTMRESNRAIDIELEDRISKALFYVEGSVPARFTEDTFQHFDGWDWTKTSIEGETPLQPNILLENNFNNPVFKLSRAKSDYLTAKRVHRVKIMRHQNPCLTAPAFLDRWHIDKVDDVTLFDWNDAGLIEFDGEAVPPQTVIDVKGHVPNYHVMRSVSDLRHCRKVSRWYHLFDSWAGAANSPGDPALRPNMPSTFSDSESPFVQVPESCPQERIDAMTAQYTAGVRPGWNQVEAIVNGMRKDFELKPNWEVDNTVDDTVDHFLNQNGGPQEMFATSCAMVLRNAGYRTRLVKGYLVQSKDYDRRARQSIVTFENLHLWPEVCLDGRYWIPVEPTPGFPVPFSTQTAWQWLMAKANAAVAWVWNHPISSLLFLAFSICSYVYRANFVTSLMLLWWHLVRIVWPQNLLRATRQLIDLRFWAAGNRRPLSKTIRSWYTRVEPGVSMGFYELWNAQNYATQQKNIGRADLIDQCRAQIDILSFKKIQNFVSENSTMESQ